MGANLGARSGAHALAMSGRYRCAYHRTATACDGGRVVCSNVGNVAAIGYGAPLRACEGTAERWHGVCVPGLGADILPPAPRQRQCAAGWLEYQNRVPIFGMRF